MEGAGAVGHGAPVREARNRWGGKLDENFAHDYFHGWRELKLDSLPEERGDRVDPLGLVAQEFAIIPHTAHDDAHLLEIPRHGHFDQGRNFVRVWTHTGGRNGVAQKNSVRAPRRAFEGEDLRLCFRRRSKSVRMVWT